jgi:uncharacterized protein (TIGR02145 family)
MMKNRIIIGLIGFLPFFGVAQGEWDNWYFGVYAGMNFASGSPVALPTSAFTQSASLTCTSVSDSSGNFLFFSDGTRVYNRNQSQMPNGFMGITHARQPSFAIQSLSNPDLYYLFASGEYAGGTLTGLRYSLIDMHLESGLGDVVDTVKNIPMLFGDSAVQQLYAIRHANNRDVWVVVMSHEIQNKYLAYLVTASGINLSPVMSNSMLNTGIGAGLDNYYGNLRISPNGTKLICSDSLAEFCEFNPETGVVTPRFLFLPTYPGAPYPYTIWKAEFSIDSRYLYLARHSGEPTTCPGLQYDTDLLDSAQFVQSKYLFWGPSGQLQMASDGKIYVNANIYTDSIHVINNPSAGGATCNFQKNVLGLLGNANNGTFPQFLQRYKAYIHFNGHCYPDTTFFYGDIWPPADSVHWDFGDPTSGFMNSSNEPAPAHKFTQPGTYTIELFVRHNDTRTDTSWRTIIIYESPTPNLGNDITICQGDSATFDAGACTDCTFSWDNLTTGQVNIGTGQTFTTSDEGNYMVTVTSPEDCIGRDTVQLTVVNEAQVIVTPASSAICSGDSISLLLNSNPPGATFSWSANGSSPLVTGYSGGTGDTIHQVLFNTDTIGHTVTYTISPQVSNCPFTPLDYPVTVFPVPDLTVDPPAIEVCSGEQVVINLSSQVPGTSFTWMAEGSSANVSGFSDGTGTQINQALINTGLDTAWVTYHISPYTTNCMGNTTDYVVPVIPTIEVTVAPPAMEICSGEQAMIDLSCNISGCDFSWIASASSPNVTGYSNGSGNTIQQQLTNSDTLSQNVVYEIAPGIIGCGSDTTDCMVTIHPLLPVSISIAASVNPVCSGIPVTFTANAFNGGGSPNFQWKVNGMNAGINSAVFEYIPQNGDVITCTLTSSEPCATSNPAISNEITMLVVDSPEVTFTPCFDTITTTDAKPIRLRGGVPLGGTYFGSSVSSASSESGVLYYFDPSIAGAGTHEITYNYINSAGCEDSAYISVFNFPFSIFNCGDSLTDIRDNHKYPTVQIGSQCWMAANLNYGTMISGSISQRDNCIPEKYYPEPCALCSALYQWDELMQYQEVEEIQGLCPPGWHVPSEADWNTLFANWTNNAFAGKALLYNGYSGFNAFLTGVGYFNHGWWFGDFATFFWSSTAHGPYKAWAHGLNEYNYSVSYYPSYRGNAFSVRCLKDQ